jgi:DNA-binding MarR family transcriptional regulator
MFHTALAEQVGLSSTEEKALDLLDREGPLTPGALAVRTGLAAPSITGLVNRLERKGFARRRTNPNDRRSFLVEARADRLSSIAPLFRSFTASLEALYAGYRKDQLETILQFLRESARIQSAATARLTAAKRRAGTN